MRCCSCNAGARLEDLVIAPRRSLPPAVIQCIEKTVKKAAVPAHQSFGLLVTLDSPALTEAFATAMKKASSCLPSLPTGAQLEPLEIGLTTMGDHSRVLMAGGQPQRKQCLENAFRKVQLPPGDLRKIFILPNETPVDI